MRKLLVAVVVLGAVVAFASPVMAGKAGLHADKAAKAAKSDKLPGFLAKLNLTDDQKVKAKDILASARQSAAGKDKAAKRQAMKDAIARIKSDVLTDTQRAQLAKHHAAKGTAAKHHAGSTVATKPHATAAAAV